MDRLKVILCAYACRPGQGSEPGVGWNLASGIARFHDVWVVTRSSNRPAIEDALVRRPVPGLHFVYHEPTLGPWRWKLRDRGGDNAKLEIEAHYYLWQLGLYSVACRLHEEIRFDLAHHVTYCRYWMPSLLAFLPVPFVWGPVGGGESVPPPLYRTLAFKPRTAEYLRDLARWIGEHDPLVRAAAKRSVVAYASTSETASRLRLLEAPRVEVCSQIGISEAELEHLERLPAPEAPPIRFLSMGRLLSWKGFDLGLQAFAEAGLDQAEYWVIGDGPERRRLRAQAEAAGIADRVRFWGQLPREEALRRLADCHVLVHPSLHDSGGMVCLEAMAVGRPVLCLDAGGPGSYVSREAGIRIPVESAAQVARELARAMRLLAENEELRTRMGAAGRSRVREGLVWEAKTESLARLYTRLADFRAGAYPPMRNQR